MRLKIVVPILLLTLAILAILLRIRPASQIAVSKITTETSTNNTPKINITNQNILTAIPQPIAKQTGIKLPVTDNKRTPEGFQKYIDSKNSPIEFYGKVIDQDSNALAGAKIKIGIRQWYVPIPSILDEGAKFIDLEQISDANGRFEFHGASGDGFGVQITKEGYELEQNKYGSGPTAGSYDNPVIFKMWSTNIHEHLISGKDNFHVVPDGRPYFINLTTDTISESGTGDLKVWIKRPEQITRRYDWSCEVDVINGELQSASDYTMWLAPASGYVPSFQFEQPVGSGWGDSTGERRFYITLNNGQEYGHITIELYAYYNNQIPAMVSIQYTINPSGSRILR